MFSSHTQICIGLSPPLELQEWKEERCLRLMKKKIWKERGGNKEREKENVEGD